MPLRPLIIFLGICVYGDYGLIQTGILALSFLFFVRDSKDMETREELLEVLLPISPARAAMNRLKRPVLCLLVIQVVGAVRLSFFPPEDGWLFEGSVLSTCVVSWLLFFTGAIFSRSWTWRFGYKSSALAFMLPVLLWSYFWEFGYAKPLLAVYLFLLFLYLIWVFIKVDHVVLASKKSHGFHLHSGKGLRKKAGAQAGRAAVGRPVRKFKKADAQAGGAGVGRPVRNLLRSEWKQLPVGRAIVCLILACLPSIFFKFDTVTSFNLLILNFFMLVGASPLMFMVRHYKDEQHDRFVFPVARKHIVQAWLLFASGYLTMLVAAVSIIHVVFNSSWPWVVLLMSPTVAFQLLYLGTCKEYRFHSHDPEQKFGKYFIPMWIGLIIVSWLLRFAGEDKFGRVAEAIREVMTMSLSPTLFTLYLLATIGLMVWRVKVYMKVETGAKTKHHLESVY